MPESAASQRVGEGDEKVGRPRTKEAVMKRYLFNALSMAALVTGAACGDMPTGDMRPETDTTALQRGQGPEGSNVVGSIGPGTTTQSSPVAVANIIAPPEVPNQYAEDWDRLLAIINFGSSSLSFAKGFVGAIKWLTGINDPAPGPTLDEIKDTITQSLLNIQAQSLIDGVNSLAVNWRETRNETASQAEFQMSMGNDPEMLMSTNWAISYLASRMSDLQNQSGDILVSLQTILERPASSANFRQEQEAVAVLPAFLMLVPLRAAAMTMIGQIIPSLKDGEDRNISEMIRSAGVTLYKAVGAYSIAFNAPVPGVIFRIDSAVGLDQSFMFKRQMYSYYHRLSNGALNTVPALRFSQYQSAPLVKASLFTLLDYQLFDNPHFPGMASGSTIRVSESRVWNPDLYSDPNDLRSRPQFIAVAEASVDSAFACSIDEANDEYSPYPGFSDITCPHSQTQGN